MPDVLLRRITLCGFGLYREPASFGFAPSLSVMVGENETGKSTLVSGILATLFGLRRESDPTEFTTARFKNWDSPPGFWGELEFTASGRLYRLRRDFETHDVMFVREDERGAAPEFKGKHNRAGRGPEVGRYADTLHRILGVQDQQVFESVFCVTQETEAIPGGLSGSVQRLVAGAGQRDLDDVVSSLVDAFRRVTSRSGDFDVAEPGKRARNATNPRELEELEHEIEDVRRRIESSGNTLASLAGLRKKLEEKQDTLERILEEQRAVDRTLRAWDRWKDLRRERDSLEGEQARLHKMMSACEELRRSLKAGGVDLLRDFPEYEDAPTALEEKFDALVDLRQREERARKERETIESQIRTSFGEGVLSGQGPEHVLGQLARKAELEADLEHKGLELQEIEVRFSQAREGRRRKAAVFGFLGLVGGILAGAAVGLESLDLVALMLGAGVVAGGIALLVIRPKLEDPETMERFTALNKDVVSTVATLAGVNDALGSLAGTGAGALGELREKLRRLVEVSGSLAETEEGVSREGAGLGGFLDAAGGEPGVARDRYGEFLERVRAHREEEARLALLMKTADAASVEDLVLKKTRLDNTVQSRIAEEQNLRREHPFLERVSRMGDSVELEKEHGGLKSRAEELARTVKTEEEEIRRLRSDVAGLEGGDLVDIASEEIRLRDLGAKQERLVLDRDAVLLAYRVTRENIARFQSSHRERLGQSVHHRFAELTGRPGRRVELDERFAPCISESGGQPCATRQLSRGAQDQLRLAIRLAVAELISGDVRLPLIFDDPFLGFDAERLGILRRALEEISTSRQIILLTHREELAGWGSAVERSTANGRVSESASG